MTAWPCTRKQDQIDAEAALDGFYVLRTPVPASELDAPAVVTAYKNLKYVERDFRHIKSDDLDLRPVFHRLEERVRAHVLICMLACYLTWHLRRAWAPLTFTDQDPPAPDNPVAPARRSAAAQAKASYQHDPAGQPYRSFRGLLEHLATLTRNQVRFTGTQVTIPMLTEPTSTQRQAFDLLGAADPAHLEVARTPPGQTRQKTRSEPEIAYRTGRNFGLASQQGDRHLLHGQQGGHAGGQALPAAHDGLDPVQGRLRTGGGRQLARSSASWSALASSTSRQPGS